MAMVDWKINITMVSGILYVGVKMCQQVHNVVTFCCLFFSMHYCFYSLTKLVVIPTNFMCGQCMHCVFWVPNHNVLRPSGTTGRGAKALWECGAPPWRAMVRRVQTRPELAEEDGRDLSAGSQQDQEYILRKLRKCELKTPGELWQGTAMDTLNDCFVPGLSHLKQTQSIHIYLLPFSCCIVLQNWITVVVTKMVLKLINKDDFNVKVKTNLYKFKIA